MKLFVRDWFKLFAVCVRRSAGFAACLILGIPSEEWCAPCREKLAELNVDPDPGDGVAIR